MHRILTTENSVLYHYQNMRFILNKCLCQRFSIHDVLKSETRSTIFPYSAHLTNVKKTPKYLRYSRSYEIIMGAHSHFVSMLNN